MLKEDKDKLREIMMNYPVKEVMKQLSSIALDVAGEVSDLGAKEMAKSYVKFSVSMDELISGRPFLL